MTRLLDQVVRKLTNRNWKKQSIEPDMWKALLTINFAYNAGNLLPSESADCPQSDVFDALEMLDIWLHNAVSPPDNRI